VLSVETTDNNEEGCPDRLAVVKNEHGGFGPTDQGPKDGPWADNTWGHQQASIHVEMT